MLAEDQPGRHGGAAPGSCAVTASVRNACSEPGVRHELMSAQDDLPGDVLAAISREMVRLKAQYYGKGATEVKTYVCDDWVFCVMKGGMTTVERTLLEHGEEQLVRQVRLRFQENMDQSFMGAVARLTGRRVLTYQSQVVFDPHFTIEIFLLSPPDPVAGPGG